MRVFDLRAATSSKEFIDFWSIRYVYPLQHLYDANIGRTLNEKRVWELFQWKNRQENIAERKRKSIQRIYLPQLDGLPKLSTVKHGRAYVTTLGGGGIWDIFWTHCINSDLFPIFDQHTYRAMVYITDNRIREIPSNRDAKIASYFDEYLPFLRRFASMDRRAVDKALFTYGQFLKSQFAS